MKRTYNTIRGCQLLPWYSIDIEEVTVIDWRNEETVAKNVYVNSRIHKGGRTKVGCYSDEYTDYAILNDRSIYERMKEMYGLPIILKCTDKLCAYQ